MSLHNAWGIVCFRNLAHGVENWGELLILTFSMGDRERHLLKVDIAPNTERLSDNNQGKTRDQRDPFVEAVMFVAVANLN